MPLNGEIEEYVTKEEFLREHGQLAAEVGQMHGLIANFLNDQRGSLQNQERRDKDRDQHYRDFINDQKRRDKLFAEKLEGLGQAARKAQDSVHDLEEVTAKTKIESLHRQLRKLEAEGKTTNDRIWWVVRLVGCLLLAAVGGGGAWEVIKPLLLGK